MVYPKVTARSADGREWLDHAEWWISDPFCKVTSPSWTLWIPWGWKSCIRETGEDQQLEP
ncbi:hypothetical protein BFJ63_vAg7098 [Fusarium oxysporum f. sp. narcissi]|uniref:Uncharacterized protein n=2 Tax=Fusarium oxysporum TaxID=5507 RepID=A0A4Q2VTN6_FUSOX|nr:hypothetical protein FOMA001_g8927 [Fusarium oxysporum f. sp. matthiolae]RKK16786.1 hypothetical protein BFJ65_g10341 [Fusarium oxysporum f. sp. cepae]RKK31723.1 hypothetical protein BFJ66_g15713 [Fusarium oxysporum f. sp. cepae]RKK47068.1 hypothetical protein BFJ67_g7966 [Fusarium oxysporum f. sp. cepae]RYC90157.1 hypothetical protein BFJ63_vAg7098 [Fusarium oxysporum f. sp. narcissi]